MDNRLSEAVAKMTKTVETFDETVRCIRTGGVTTSVIDTVKVEAYGQSTPLKHLAMTSGSPNQPISVKPYDTTLVPEINRALQKQGFSSYVFSKDTVCVQIPVACGEERDKIRLHVKKLGEEAKIAIRNIRKNYRNNLEKLSESKDDLKLLEGDLQKLTDKAISEICKTVDFKISQI